MSDQGSKPPTSDVCLRCKHQRWKHRPLGQCGWKLDEVNDCECEGFMESPDVLSAKLAEVTAERDALKKLAYIGEHQHADSTWKARCDELTNKVKSLEASIDALHRECERTFKVTTGRDPSYSSGARYSFGITTPEMLAAVVQDHANLKSNLERARKEALEIHGRYVAAHAALDSIGAPPKENPDGVSVARSVADRIALLATWLRPTLMEQCEQAKPSATLKRSDLRPRNVEQFADAVCAFIRLISPSLRESDNG